MAFAALASATVPVASRTPEAATGIKTLLEEIAQSQLPDGSWAHTGGRAPTLESQEVATLIAMLALASEPMDSSEGAAAERLKRGQAWLSEHPEPSTLQALVLRVLVETRLGGEPAVRESRIDAILALQRPDGGWSQAEGLESDAFATGQTLYTLAAAGVSPSHPALVRARDYLVSTPNDDGSWPMASRPIPPDGAPSKNLSPITLAGSAWATLGLLRTVPSEAKPAE
jgi:hypothetical protein